MTKSATAATTFLAATIIFTGPLSAQRFVRQDSLRALPTPVLLETAGLFQDRYAVVGEDIFIAGQPTERALREMKARGVTTVVNLRSPPEMARIGYDEARLVAELGMKYVYLPVRGGSGEFAYSPSTLRAFADVMRSAEGKVLLHCTVAWRASHLWAAWLIEQGVPVPDALAHTRAINLMDDHRMEDGKQPLELFLGRPVPGLGRPE
ncbi:MAG: beta-lactamase hydrolase domain-containing protein [Gemmatimonadota bacterium]